MRAGIYSVQQALTVEAVSIVKQAVTLARRRGHAQVTPLHVASSMLASCSSLLRRACLQSHSHPLQCKALELCFNVALNRLPASTSSALLGSHSSYPSFSNALVAAFKRAQAHQRRGSIENQQQPILALKVEIEQLIISILDDPSVSRVMREAGFSSTHVKNKIEQTVSMETSCNQTSTPSSLSKESTKTKIVANHMSQSSSFSQFGVPLVSKQFEQARNEEVTSVLNTMMNKKKNVVITSESLSNAESVVRGVMDKLERGKAPGDLMSVRFITLPLLSLRNLSKEELEQKLIELRCIVKSYMRIGVVLYLGDLKWVGEFWSTYGEQRRSYYSTVEHIILELKQFVSGIGETGRLWLMGIATFQTYMKCKAGHPSLETLWQLHPLTVPVGSLSLSLNLDSENNAHFESKNKDFTCQAAESRVDTHLSWWRDSSVNYGKDFLSLTGNSIKNKELQAANRITISSISSLPAWLRQHKEEIRSRDDIEDNKESLNVTDVCKKWNSFCDSVDKQHPPTYPEETIKFASSPPSPISTPSHERKTNLSDVHLSWPEIFEQKQLSKENRIWTAEYSDESSNLLIDTKPDLLSNPNSSPNSASSSEAVDDDLENLQSFKELNADNLQILCSELEKRVPWQKGIIPDIASTILECRSGSKQRKTRWNNQENDHKEETWLFFLGVDAEGKKKIARDIARLVFGSQSNFVSIGLSNSSPSKRVDSDDDDHLRANKRTREELGFNYYERFGLALNQNPHRVFFMEDVDQVDYSSQKSMKEAIESGRVRVGDGDGETVPLKDAIIIFSCKSFKSELRAFSPPPPCRKQKPCHNENSEEEFEEKSLLIVPALDLNIAIEEEGDNGAEYHSVSENDILGSVDRQIVFKIQEL